MSYNPHLQQNSFSNHSRNNDKSSIESLFQGLVPRTGADNISMLSSSAASNDAPAQHLAMHMNPLEMGMVPSSMLGGASEESFGGSSYNDDRKRLQQLQQLQASQYSQGRQGNFSDELKRLQQLQQLTSSGQNASMHGPFGNPSQSSLTMNSFSQGGPLGSLSQREAATYLLMSQQQRALQQQLQLGGIGASQAAQLASAGGAPLPSPSMLAARSTWTAGLGPSTRVGPGSIEPFPEKLHRLLSEVEATGRSDIISWVDKGKAFAIHKPADFFKSIVPLYFRQSRLSSFKRQLNLYGFELISNGPSRGAYFHELFHRDQPQLCRRMRRVAVKVSAKKKVEEAAEGAGEGEGACKTSEG